MTEQQLIENLSLMKNQNAVLSMDNDYSKYAVLFLQNIGSTDAYLRDTLIYEIFAEWIEKGKFTKSQLSSYMNVCLDEKHLMFQINEIKSDAVFTRTFSALIIASILEYHNKHVCLSESQVRKVYHTILSYYNLEKDLRGYTKEHGWAHAMAHGADMIDQIAECRVLREEELCQLLLVMQKKICQSDHVFIEREPNRIAKAVVHIFKREELSQDRIICWIQSLRNTAGDASSAEYLCQRVNIENFIRCLYFQTKLEYSNIELLNLLELKAMESCIH